MLVFEVIRIVLVEVGVLGIAERSIHWRGVCPEGKALGAGERGAELRFVGSEAFECGIETGSVVVGVPEDGGDFHIGLASVERHPHCEAHVDVSLRIFVRASGLDDGARGPVFLDFGDRAGIVARRV
jgi:hypothetical protein